MSKLESQLLITISMLDTLLNKLLNMSSIPFTGKLKLFMMFTTGQNTTPLLISLLMLKQITNHTYGFKESMKLSDGSPIILRLKLNSLKIHSTTNTGDISIKNMRIHLKRKLKLISMLPLIMSMYVMKVMMKLSQSLLN